MIMCSHVAAHLMCLQITLAANLTVGVGTLGAHAASARLSSL